MNLFARNTGRETLQAQKAEPYTARRAVRYAAADNAQAALQRQFPGATFALAQVAMQPVAHQQKPVTDTGAQDGAAQVA
jgi:hypothetical protein